MKWHEKHYEYVPQADAVAYLVQDHTEKARDLSLASNYRTWPGYLPFSLELVPLLSRLDHLEAVANVNDVLDFIVETQGTALCDVVVKDLIGRLSRRSDLQTKLIESLEECYQSKERNLRQLRYLHRAVKSIIPSPGPEAPPRIRLLWTVLALQDANHDGDPARAKECAKSYRSLRSVVLDYDRELVANTDLNLIVHYNDTFDFHAALRMNEALVSDPGFTYLTPVTRARAWSSHGQCLAFTGRGAEAVDSFETALTEFDGLLKTGHDVAGDIDQTRVYAAINAIDARLTNAGELAKGVIGPFEAAVDELANADPLHRSYHHHLLLRLLWFTSGNEHLIKRYLTHLPKWQETPQHPWELINCYRALMLWKYGSIGEQEVAKVWFRKAVDICSLEHHGSTLSLIGAAAATAASCCMEDESFVAEAQRLLDKVGTTLPDAGETIAGLWEVLTRPGAELVNRALEQLPFNYH
jgi:hypothetical protein